MVHTVLDQTLRLVWERADDSHGRHGPASTAATFDRERHRGRQCVCWTVEEPLPAASQGGDVVYKSVIVWKSDVHVNIFLAIKLIANKSKIVYWYFRKTSIYTFIFEPQK